MVTGGRALAVLVALAVQVAACSSGSSSGNGSSGGDGGADTASLSDGSASPDGDGGVAMNAATIVVDNGPSDASINTLYTTVTLCRPGTTTCQTIDHIEVDTGSTGLRIVASVLDPALMLPQQMAGDGNPLVECYRYVDGFNWGPVAVADVQLGGETAAAVPMQLLGEPGFTIIPPDCSSVGPEEDTVMTLGGNGLMGIGFNQADCGSACAATMNPRAPAYYSCTSTACTAASVPVASQLQNVVGLFPHDNNGVAVQLPAIDPAGAASVTGSLIFGIGTASNNGLGAAQVMTIDPIAGHFTTLYGGKTFNASFLDTGSLAYAFPDTTIAQCKGDFIGFFCPASPLSLMATNVGRNGVSIPAPFVVAAGDAIYASHLAAFDDLAITSFTPGYFDWGLPFFYGRTVFTAIGGAMTPGGPGPYFAY